MEDELQKPINTNKVRELLDINSGARIRSWLSICSRCGLCAESCFFYLANDKNPKLSPAYKVKATLGELYRRKGQVIASSSRNVTRSSGENAPCASAAPCTARLESI